MKTHYAGSIMSDVQRALDDDTLDITIDQVQANGSWGIHQARLRIVGDDTVYRMLIAPANAPIGLPYGGERHTPIDNHFAEPLA